MYVSYNDLPSNSRVWIYQSDRYLTIEELELISVRAINFIDQWTRHGEDLKGSFTVKYNQFIVLTVDESYNSVSGCSIDASVRFIRELEKDLGIDLTDKLNTAYRDNGIINLIKLADLESSVKDGSITKNTIVFNNMVNVLGDIETKWEIPVKDSWHSRYL